MPPENCNGVLAQQVTSACAWEACSYELELPIPQCLLCRRKASLSSLPPKANARTKFKWVVYQTPAVAGSCAYCGGLGCSTPSELSIDAYKTVLAVDALALSFCFLAWRTLSGGEQFEGALCDGFACLRTREVRQSALEVEEHKIRHVCSPIDQFKFPVPHHSPKVQSLQIFFLAVLRRRTEHFQLFEQDRSRRALILPACATLRASQKRNASRLGLRGFISIISWKLGALAVTSLVTEIWQTHGIRVDACCPPT